jgi:hypothetical protein
MDRAASKSTNRWGEWKTCVVTGSDEGLAALLPLWLFWYLREQLMSETIAVV